MCFIVSLQAIDVKGVMFAPGWRLCGDLRSSTRHLRSSTQERPCFYDQAHGLGVFFTIKHMALTIKHMACLMGLIVSQASRAQLVSLFLAPFLAVL